MASYRELRNMALWAARESVAITPSDEGSKIADAVYAYFSDFGLVAEHVYVPSCRTGFEEHGKPSILTDISYGSPHS